jgi:uncharacterized protein
MAREDTNGTDELQVRHEKAARRFAARLDRRIAYLSYDQIDEKTLDYAHVFVPPEFRGGGVASAVTKAALDYARDSGFSVVPSCPFVSAYVRRHPEYQDLVDGS